MKKARPTPKQRFKNAGRNPTRTTTPDPVRWLSRKQQTTIFRLRTGHNRLDTIIMFNKLKIGENDLCACGLAPQNTEHVLQVMSGNELHTPLRSED